jgi:hypothetical protein
LWRCGPACARGRVAGPQTDESGGGLYRFENSQLQVFNNKNVGLPSDTVTALALAANGVLVIGTDRGLAQIANGALTVISDTGSAAVSSVAVTGDALWVGTVDDGAFHFDGSRWTPLTPADGLPSLRISALLADGNDVWIGGQDGGLVRFQPSR